MTHIPDPAGVQAGETESNGHQGPMAEPNPEKLQHILDRKTKHLQAMQAQVSDVLKQTQAGDLRDLITEIEQLRAENATVKELQAANLELSQQVDGFTQARRQADMEAFTNQLIDEARIQPGKVDYVRRIVGTLGIIEHDAESDRPRFTKGKTLIDNAKKLRSMFPEWTINKEGPPAINTGSSLLPDSGINLNKPLTPEQFNALASGKAKIQK